MTTTIAPTTTTNGPADDGRGLCHRLRDGETLCGAPPARDSPGTHSGDTISGRCTGCGRLRCPDCGSRP
jgi:hypothetical protein